MQMPFGKYEDYEVSDVPVSYARWCVDNLDLDGDLLAELEERAEGVYDNWGDGNFQYIGRLSTDSWD